MAEIFSFGHSLDRVESSMGNATLVTTKNCGQASAFCHCAKGGGGRIMYQSGQSDAAI